MFNSVTPKKIIELVEKELKEELFRPNGNLRVDLDKYRKMAKKKRGEKVPRGRENGKTIYTPWVIYELGYNGTLYKLHIAINDDTEEVMVHGFLDANSSHNIFVSNVNWSETEATALIDFRKHGGLSMSQNPRTYRVKGLTALIRLKENIL